MSEEAYKQQAFAILQDHFEIHKEISGKHFSGRWLQMDAIAVPKNKTDWKNKNIALGIEFKDGSSSICCFYHPGRDYFSSPNPLNLEFAVNALEPAVQFLPGVIEGHWLAFVPALDILKQPVDLGQPVVDRLGDRRILAVLGAVTLELARPE